MGNLRSIFTKPWVRVIAPLLVVSLGVLLYNTVWGPGAGDKDPVSQDAAGTLATGDPNALPTSTSTPGSKTDGSGQTSTASPSPLPKDPFPPDYVLAPYDRVLGSDYPEDCRLRVGEACRVHFYIKYRLVNAERGLIRFGVWEDGATDPVSFAEFPVNRGKATVDGRLTFSYEVKSSVKTVKFKGILLGPDGSVLYDPDKAGRPTPELAVN